MENVPSIVKTLVNLDLIDSAQATAIDFEQKDMHESLSAVFDNGLISSKKMSKELSNRFGTPLFDLNAIDLDSIPTSLVDMKIVNAHMALPFYRHGKKLYVAIVDPTNKTALDSVKFYTGLDVVPIQVEVEAMTYTLNRINESSQEGNMDSLLGGDDLELDLETDEGDPSDQEEDLGFDPNDAPIVKYVNKLLVDAINQGASDIHIEPFEKELRVRYRVDGVLKKVATQPAGLSARIAARVKIISKLDIAERRAPQDGRVKLKITKNKAFDFRVNSLPTVWGEKIVMRLLDSSAAKLNLEKLGFNDIQLTNYRDAVNRPYGMVLITGPTGSGKTVTLYSALNMLNSPETNISTVEDPVEIQLPGITQVNINERANLNFASALKAFLRQDPDIIMLGEIRDLETAEIAIKAAQTGHMVLSTLHTNDAPATLTRLLNMGVPAFNVASAVQLIVAQRLARRLCKKCKEPAELPDKVLIDAGFKESEIENLKIFQPNTKGCGNCSSGYKGRLGIFQVMPIDDSIKQIIMEGGTERDIERAATDQGILDLRLSGLEKVADGITSLEEIERVTNV